VSRGGRPDLAFVTAIVSTHFITGIIGMNKMAFDELHQLKKMKIVPGANTF
jgi:hypothetical protein